MDFSDATLDVTIPAGSTSVTADIPIIDDEINEADEEFVVVLEVVGNITNPVVFTTNAAVCRIPPNDRKGHLKCIIIAQNTRDCFSCSCNANAISVNC